MDAIDLAGDVLEVVVSRVAPSVSRVAPSTLPEPQTGLDARQPHRETLIIDCHEGSAGMECAACVWGGRIFTASQSYSLAGVTERVPSPARKMTMAAIRLME